MAEQVGARQWLDGPARRDGGGDGLEQFEGVRDADGSLDPAPFGPTPVEHGKAGVEGGAAACVGAAVDNGCEQHTGRRVEGCECILPGGIAGDAVGGGDGHQPPARRQHREGGADVAQVGIVADTVHAGARREGRVHQDHGGPQLRQAVPDRLGVVAGDGNAGKKPDEKPGPGDGDLVEVQGLGRPAFPSAHCAMTASIPVPAEGSSTTSPGRIAAACNAAYANGSGVENC